MRYFSLIDNNKKCQFQQTTLQNRELMERFQDERPNGELSSSDSGEAIDDYPYPAASSSKGHPSQTTTSANKPNLVNGHSPKTYHNGFRGRGEEPVVRKGVPSRDYFEDSDSYPKLVSPGEGEPDICDDAEYCDSDNNEDQTKPARVLHDNGGTDLDVGDRIAESHKADVRSDESVTFQPNSGLSGRTESSTENRNGNENFALHSENSKDIHDSIVFRSQVSGHNEPIRWENGATSGLDSDFKSLDTKQSDMVAQDTDMDCDAHKDDELMVSICGSGKISLVPSDEPRKPTAVSHQKGSYVGPAEHKKASDTGFSDQKKRFEALRKKFSEPGNFSKSSSDSDSEENRQKKRDEPEVVVQKHVDHEQVPLPDKNSREEDPHVATQGNLFYFSPPLPPKKKL